ncbi:hypothetical protein TNCV_2048841, partial [Trichonephila clavipes]
RRIISASLREDLKNFENPVSIVKLLLIKGCSTSETMNLERLSLSLFQIKKPENNRISSCSEREPKSELPPVLRKKNDTVVTGPVLTIGVGKFTMKKYRT